MLDLIIEFMILYLIQLNINTIRVLECQEKLFVGCKKQNGVFLSYNLKILEFSSFKIRPFSRLHSDFINASQNEFLFFPSVSKEPIPKIG